MTHHLWHSAWNPEGLPNKDMPAPSARISYTKEEIETFFSFFDILTLLVRETADAPEGVGSASGSMHLQERPQVYLKILATNQKVSLYWEQQVRAPKAPWTSGKSKAKLKEEFLWGMCSHYQVGSWAGAPMAVPGQLYYRGLLQVFPHRVPTHNPCYSHAIHEI